MKKLLSLLLVLMGLCALLPAATAEAPALNLPITAQDYMASYEALLADVVEGVTVTWNSTPMEDGECWMAVVNDSFVSVMVLTAGGQAREIAVLIQGALDEDTLMTFLSMAGYAGAALLRSEAVTSEAACDAFVAEMFNVLSAINQGQQPENIYGLPGGINVSTTEDGACQYYFVLSLTDAQ